MSKIVCITCSVAMRPKKNGVEVVVMTTNPVEPYQLWMADKWYCPNCQIHVIAGFGLKPIWEHHYEKPLPAPLTERYYDYEKLTDVPERTTA